MKVRATLVAAAMALTIAPCASGTIIFTTGNNPQPNEENILFHGPGTEEGPALTVTGLTNTTNMFVSFTSSENLVTPSSGQARIEAEDGAFQDLSIGLPGGTFGDFILNPIIAGRGNTVQGTILFTVHQAGEPDATFNLTASSAGNNYLTILAAGGERITGIDLLTSLSIASLQQNRISAPFACPPGSVDPLCVGPSPGTLPEPGVLALLGLGIAGVAALRRQKAT
jgi:hypothetical protein